MGREQKNPKYFPEETEGKSSILKLKIASIYQSLAMSGRAILLVGHDLIGSTLWESFDSFLGQQSRLLLSYLSISQTGC